MNKDIVCQVPALVGPGKTPVQDSAGAWLPWALLPASAAAELSQWLGGRPGAGGLGSVGATLAGPEGRRLGSQTDLPGGLHLWLSLPTSPYWVSLPATQGSGKHSPRSSVHGFTYSADLAEALRVCSWPWGWGQSLGGTAPMLRASAAAGVGMSRAAVQGRGEGATGGRGTGQG